MKSNLNRIKKLEDIRASNCMKFIYIDSGNTIVIDGVTYSSVDDIPKESTDDIFIMVI